MAGGYSAACSLVTVRSACGQPSMSESSGPGQTCRQLAAGNGDGGVRILHRQAHNLMRCANTGAGRWFGRPCVVSGRAFEDRDEAVAVDLDGGDMGFDDCFALAGWCGSAGGLSIHHDAIKAVHAPTALWYSSGVISITSGGATTQSGSLCPGADGCSDEGRWRWWRGPAARGGRACLHGLTRRLMPAKRRSDGGGSSHSITGDWQNGRATCRSVPCPF